MYVKVEPSGCCERKGMVQVRFCMYLGPSDYGYDKHHVQLPVIPEEGYQGKVDEMDSPIDIEDYNNWIASLPKAWQTNSFHNHFIQVEPDVTDKEIMDIGETFLHEAYIKWACEEKLNLVNDALPFKRPPAIDAARIAKCETRVQTVMAITIERRI